MNRYVFLMSLFSAVLFQSQLNPCLAQMSSPALVVNDAELANADVIPLSTSTPRELQYKDEIQEAQAKWQLATKRKWLGYGIAVISSVVSIDRGPSTLSSAGYLVGGIMSLAGMIGEEVQKHHYSRAVSNRLKNLQENQIQSTNVAAPKVEFDFLIPPPTYRSCTLDDLKTGSNVWFKSGESPVLVIGKIQSTSSRGSRVYVTVSFEGKEESVPMGDIYIPL